MRFVLQFLLVTAVAATGFHGLRTSNCTIPRQEIDPERQSLRRESPRMGQTVRRVSGCRTGLSSIYASMGGWFFVPEGQYDSSQARSALQFGRLERGARGDLCPKVVQGFKPGLNGAKIRTVWDDLLPPEVS
jgi:hypothetical protein